MPFLNLQGLPPARIKLEQLRGADGQLTGRFEILEGFQYHDAVLGKTYVVPAGGDPTDLASVPWAIWWLIASYGRHTAAAILHDTLIVDSVEDPPGQKRPMTRAERVEADLVFFHALEESGNNWLRHRLMWAAVSSGLTMRKSAPARCVLFFAHLAVFWIAVLWAVGGLAWIQRQPWISWIPFVDGLHLDRHREAAAIVALVLLLLGIVWAFVPTAARELAWWLWYVAALGLGILAAPLVLIFVSVWIVWMIDYLSAILQALTRGGWERPVRPAPLHRRANDALNTAP
jgi:hypothetical protein